MKRNYGVAKIYYDEVRIMDVSCIDGSQNKHVLVLKDNFDKFEELSETPALLTAYTSVYYYLNGIEVAYKTTQTPISTFEELGGEYKDFSDEMRV